MSSTKKITFSALMVALSTVLMFVSKLLPAPWLQGGSVTIASMVPIIAASVILGGKWGILSALVYSVLQMMTGFYPPPTQTFLSFVLVVLLDYVLAYGVLGLAGYIYSMLGKKAYAVPVSAFVVTTLRYVCHILSGLLIWGVYAPEGQTVLMYSLIYNGTYMVPEIIISTITAALLSKVFQKLS